MNRSPTGNDRSTDERSGASRSRVEVSGGSGDHPHTLDPEEAFKIIGNETRLEILDVLWGPEEPEPMVFGELRRAVGMRDGSQFNYHLKKLIDGGFIERIDGRYNIRHAGLEVVLALRSGYLTEHPEIEPFETTGRCFACDGPLRARYAAEMFFVECAVCDQLVAMGWFPPNAFDGRTPEEALLAFDRVARTWVDLADAGICSRCNARVERTLARDWSEVPVRSPYLDPERDGALAAWYVCGHCGIWLIVGPGRAVLDHPVVVTFYREHGVDLRSIPRWGLPWVVDESFTEVVSEEPFRVRLTVALEGDELVLTLDEAFDVLDVERG